ncbi:M10 family metallopeptidase [Aestuariibius sp. 2305UL40-4]|uniref:M10 family metallopeptidase n=1 Tax=Aestuariibius violaceus TaxID=3234132 RepID=UPI00345F0410
MHHDHDHEAGLSGPESTFAPDQPRSLEGIANFIRAEFWSPRQFDTGSENEITVNLTGLTAEAQVLAREALEAWADVTGITFTETTGQAQITFDDEDSGAYAFSSISNGEILSSNVNISTDWIAAYDTGFDSYSFQTYIHEIGHALGLGHGGFYNGSGRYPDDADYANDSWQATVMSYFSQTENTFVDASFAFVTTPMPADVIAVQDMYGTATDTRTGDTTYGFNDTTGEARLDFTSFDMPVTLTIADSGGEDTIDLSGYGSDQTINLNDQTYSDYGGGTGNLAIARDTGIENAVGGSGDDTLIGNELSNELTGGAGADTFVFDDEGFGTDTITDFETGIDDLAFEDGADLSDFDLSDTDGGALLVAADGSSILIEDVMASELTSQSLFA